MAAEPKNEQDEVMSTTSEDEAVEESADELEKERICKERRLARAKAWTPEYGIEWTMRGIRNELSECMSVARPSDELAARDLQIRLIKLINEHFDWVVDNPIKQKQKWIGVIQRIFDETQIVVRVFSFIMGLDVNTEYSPETITDNLRNVIGNNYITNEQLAELEEAIYSLEEETYYDMYHDSVFPPGKNRSQLVFDWFFLGQESPFFRIPHDTDVKALREFFAKLAFNNN